MIRIAITGPESSGKSTLTKALNKALKSTCFPEFARSYLEDLNRIYTKNDLDIICDGHLAQFIHCQDELQFVDTDFVVLKVWSEVKYHSTSPKITAAIEANYFDLHLLCTPDIPWEYDPQREHRNGREELFEHYKKELTATGKHFVIISGKKEERIKKSLAAIATIKFE